MPGWIHVPEEGRRTTLSPPECIQACQMPLPTWVPARNVRLICREGHGNVTRDVFRQYLASHPPVLYQQGFFSPYHVPGPGRCAWFLRHPWEDKVCVLCMPCFLQSPTRISVSPEDHPIQMPWAAQGNRAVEPLAGL